VYPFGMRRIVYTYDQESLEADGDMSKPTRSMESELVEPESGNAIPSQRELFIEQAGSAPT
jgi:hypothetical protein